MTTAANDSLSKQIFREELWTGSNLFTNIAVGTIEYLYIKTGASECVLSLDIVINGAFRVILYEDSTISADGTSVTNYNMRRSSSESLLATTFHTPTVGAAGTAISTIATGDDGRIPKASAFDSDNGMILKASSDYLVSLHAQSRPLTTASVTWFLREI